MRKYIRPIFIIGFGLAVAYFLYWLGQTKPQAISDTPPIDVEVEILKPTNHQILISSTGTTQPITQTALTSEVGGEIIYRSKKFSEGSSVIEGEILAKIDDTDLQLQYNNALFQLRTAEVQSQVQKAEAEVAEEVWGKIGEGTAKDLTLKKPQLKQAEAALNVAKAQLESAKKKLDKTDITAPYTGRIQSVNIDLGSTILPGQPVGVIYTANQIEISLPVKDSDLAFLDIPMDGRKLNDNEKSLVKVSALYKGKLQVWTGNIERVDGVIDPVTRMIKIIASFKNEFLEENQTTLPIGLFVEAEINGKFLENVFIVPNVSLTTNNEILIVDRNNQIEMRKIVVLKKLKDSVIIKDGLSIGERIIVSKLNIATSGMDVNPKYR
tara:strand:+ start:2523 stop:3665 length:1143 start_codon:yes stop_codon:yes gene_type:complete